MPPDSEVTDDFIHDAVSWGRGYTLVLYRAGPSSDMSDDDARQAQNGHLRFIFGLKAQGRILLAGPLADDGPLRGIAIMDVQTVVEAEELLADDPAVKAGRLAVEVHPWFGLPGDGLPG